MRVDLRALLLDAEWREADCSPVALASVEPLVGLGDGDGFLQAAGGLSMGKVSGRRNGLLVGVGSVKRRCIRSWSMASRG